jgi:Holliday junction resolvase RusA-like endonuclease
MIDIVVYGKPVGKARPRFGRSRTGKAVAYTPFKTKKYEQEVKTLAQVAMFGKSMLEGPVRVTVAAYFSHKTKTGYHTSRPDLDNIIKAILDGLNGIVFHDDAAVAEIIASKKYGEDRVEVQVQNV